MRRKLKAPPLIPQIYIFLVLYCYFWTYDDDISLILPINVDPRINLHAMNLN